MFEGSAIDRAKQHDSILVMLAEQEAAFRRVSEAAQNAIMLEKGFVRMMKSTRKAFFMETTMVPPERTVGEISGCLIQAGATQIATDYEAGKIKGLRWTMRVNGRSFLFAMPARVEPIYQAFAKRRRPNFERDVDLRYKAERVAWRQLLRWVQAQLAMIECGMTEPTEVFFPYLTSGETGQTMYSLFVEKQLKLPPPEKPQSQLI